MMEVPVASQFDVEAAKQAAEKLAAAPSPGRAEFNSRGQRPISANLSAKGGNCMPEGHEFH